MTDQTRLFDFDSSDEEDLVNTIGNVPLEFYKDCDHVGYDTSGRKIQKPDVNNDLINDFLDKCNNPNRSTIIKHPLTGQLVQLSENDIMMIKKICRGVAHSRTDPLLDSFYFTNEISEMPVRSVPPQKSNFVPSAYDRKMVSDFVHAIKMGFMKMPQKQDDEDDIDELTKTDYGYLTGLDNCNCWGESENPLLKKMSENNLQWLHPSLVDPLRNSRLSGPVVPEPPIPNPKTEESYNVPVEYLYTDEQKRKYDEIFYDPVLNPCKHRSEKPLYPVKMESLRHCTFHPQVVINLEKSIRDEVNAARVQKSKVHSSSEKLLKACAPKFNSRNCGIYPNAVTNELDNNEQRVINLDVKTRYVATISDDYVRIFCGPFKVREYPIKSIFANSVTSYRNHKVKWNPVEDILAVSYGNKVQLINPKLDTNKIKLEIDTMGCEPSNKKTKLECQWSYFDHLDYKMLEKCVGIDLEFNDEHLLDFSWHYNGNYFVTITGKGTKLTDGGKLTIHNLKTRSSFVLSNKYKWHTARFHPNSTSRYLYVAESNNKTSCVEIYDLGTKDDKPVKKLEVPGSFSTMEIHPTRDHLIVGTFEGKVMWYAMEFGVTPYKVTHINNNAIRTIDFSTCHELFAVGTAGGSVVIFFAKIYDDDYTMPALLIVKVFKNLDKQVTSLKFKSEGCTLYAGGENQNIYTLQYIQK